jgi:hypothetical protein
MSKARKLNAIKKALQPERPTMDKLFYRIEGKNEPVFHSEIIGTGKEQIFASRESVENYLKFLQTQ